MRSQAEQIASARRGHPRHDTRHCPYTNCMTLPDSAIGAEVAFGWKTYSVSRRDKAPLLEFIVRALESRECRVLHASRPDKAPFYVVFETPGGERHGVLVYAFLANKLLTRNRPSDEHRFQIKYGGELRGILDVAVDPHALITTIFLGIDLERSVFVAADPIMNNPSPMSRSIEFKDEHIDEILRTGWTAWERNRRQPKTKDRPTPEIAEDTRIQVLIGGTQEHILDLIQLERIARGLDPGERHLVVDSLLKRRRKGKAATASHKLLKELGLPSEALFDLIDGASRLKMAVRGWVAERHLEDTLRKMPGVTECTRIDVDGQPDLSLRWKGSAPILIECKNVLRQTDKAGHPRVDFQRTRASKGDPCSRYYMRSDFAVLAACLHAITEKWRFAFAATDELMPHARCPGRLASNVTVAEPLFTPHPESVFYKCSGRS